MNDGGVGPGMGAFTVFFILAIVLWLLMRNMNARLRRMDYAHKQEDAQAARAAQTHSAGGDPAAQAQPPTGGQAETADKADDQPAAVLDQGGEVEHRHPAQRDIDGDVEPSRGADPQHAEEHTGDGADPDDEEHGAALVARQEQREGGVAPGDDQEDVRVVEALEETGHLRAPGAAVVDRGHPEEQDGRDREDRCADPGREVIRDDDEHQAGQQGQRSHRQVQPAAKVGLDGRDDRIDALFEGVKGAGP